MIRQAINCDMCGAERLESSSYWFVADEVKGEIRLRGWDTAQKSRRNARHLCGQKCLQRMVDNFTAAMLAGQQAGKVIRETEPAAVPTAPEESLDDLPVLERMGYDRETIAAIEAESWAGPVKPKELSAKERWGTAGTLISERSFLHPARVKPQPTAMHRLA